MYIHMIKHTRRNWLCEKRRHSTLLYPTSVTTAKQQLKPGTWTGRTTNYYNSTLVEYPSRVCRRDQTPPPALDRFFDLRRGSVIAPQPGQGVVLPCRKEEGFGRVSSRRDETRLTCTFPWTHRPCRHYCPPSRLRIHRGAFGL